MKSRVMVIGLDGGTWKVLDPLLKQGKLPNIQKIIEQGVRSEMHTTIPSQTVPAWPACFTGVNPGKLGICHFLSDSHKDYDEGKPVTINDIKVKTIWDYMTEYNKFSMSVMVPLTFPPQAINGFVITPIRVQREAGRAEIQTFPPELYEELQGILNMRLDAVAEEKNKVDRMKERDFRNTRKVFLEKMKKLYLMGIDKIGEGIIHLMKKNEDWDFIMAVFTPIDVLQHRFWRFMDTSHLTHDPELAESFGDAIAEGYVRADKAIGDIINNAGEDLNVLIASDHGFAPIDRYFYVNEFLKNLGMLQTKDVSPYKLRMRRHKLEKIIRRLRLGFLVNRIPERIRNMSVPIIKRDALATSELIDWEHTEAYAISLGININLQGREPNGIVPPEDYDTVVDKIRKELYALKDPETGKRIVGEVHTKEELFSGPYLESLPDIVYLLAEPNYFFQKSLDAGRLFSRIPSDHPISAHHINSLESAYKAIFMAYGKDIKQTTLEKTPRIIDIPATVMYLMGLPVPEDMDGRVLTEIIDDDFLSKNPVRYEQVDIYKEREAAQLSAEEEGRIKSSLRDLGYLE